MQKNIVSMKNNVMYMILKQLYWIGRQNKVQTLDFWGIFLNP